MKWQENKIVTFKGCCWDAGWEFDSPLIIYAPVKRYYDNNHSLVFESFLDKFQDIMIDLCVYGEIEDDFSIGDKKEFKWRGWSESGFSKRKSAMHCSIQVKMQYNQDGEKDFEIIKGKEKHG